MKRANGEGTIKKRKNGTWEGQYVAGRDEKGRLIRRSVYGKTQAEVSKKLTTMTNDLNTGIYISPDDITVGQWFDIWHSDYLGSVKQSTAAQYQYQIEQNIKPNLGSIKLQKLTAPMIQNLYKRKLADLSPKSIKNLHGVMHKGLNQAVLCLYLKSNPCLACQLPRIEKKEMAVLTGNDLKNFLDEIKGKPFEYVYICTIFTGLRESEIIGLTWDCINFDKGIIKVYRQLKRERQSDNSNRYIFDTLKNGKTRSISPAPFVFDVLKRVKSEQAKNRLKMGNSYINPDNLVFTNEIGTHLCSHTLLKHFKAHAAAIGRPELRFHDLRHSFATISLENGDDAKTVSENLGHATVAFTLDVYGHVTDRMKKESADRMQKYFENLGG